MIYGIVCVALIRLRNKDAVETGFFKIPYGKFIAVAGILVTIWLLSSSKLNELRDVAIAVSVGLIIYFLKSIRKIILKSKFNYYLLNILISLLIWGSISVIFSINTKQGIISYIVSYVVSTIIFFMIAPYEKVRKAHLKNKTLL